MYTYMIILTLKGNSSTIYLAAEVAQVVEQRTENPRVVSSTLTLGTMNGMSGSSSVVERLLAKEKAASSNLVFRSIPLIPKLYPLSF